MKYFLFTFFFSTIYTAYYNIGDTISIEHQQHPIEICHSNDGNNNGETISLADNIGKITVLGLEIPW